MNFDHCVLQAAERAIEWNDLPDHLMPLMIMSEVAHVRYQDIEGMGQWPWH